MEAVVCEDSPLAAYLEGQGEDAPHELPGHDADAESVPSSPSFAPRGMPRTRLKKRHMLPPLRSNNPKNRTVATIHDKCSKALNSTIGRTDNERFLEQFRYMIVASQLLNTHSFGQVGTGHSQLAEVSSIVPPQLSAFTLGGAATTAICAFLLVWLVHWARDSGGFRFGRSRIAISLCLMVVLAVVSYAWVRRQWLQYLRQHTLKEASDLLLKSQDFDTVASGAFSLVQEVELVSRGYRISTPLPPITRLEDRSQTRRCVRLRKVLRLCFAEVIPRYVEACVSLRPLVEQMDLEKYYDVYDVSELDLTEANLGYSDTEFEDLESLRVLKILASRFHTIRKTFLCCLLALDARGGRADFIRWSAAVHEIQAIGVETSDAEQRLRRILDEEQSFPVPPTPKLPLTPGRERWRAQLRKLNTLSSGIRGLQAKLHVLREESDVNLNNTEDVSGLGANLMVQFESIGIDLKALMQEWEDAKAALASNIDRNERRLSSMIAVVSPTTSLGGRTAVEDGSAPDASKESTEEANSRSSYELSSSDSEEIFEAVAVPRPTPTSTREERITKMKVERARRASMKEKREANTHLLRELQTVISMRLRGRTNNANTGGRVASL